MIGKPNTPPWPMPSAQDYGELRGGTSSANNRTADAGEAGMFPGRNGGRKLRSGSLVNDAPMTIGK
jgi:hypothetical protein